MQSDYKESFYEDFFVSVPQWEIGFMSRKLLGVYHTFPAKIATLVAHILSSWNMSTMILSQVELMEVVSQSVLFLFFRHSDTQVLFIISQERLCISAFLEKKKLHSDHTACRIIFIWVQQWSIIIYTIKYGISSQVSFPLTKLATKPFGKMIIWPVCTFLHFKSTTHLNPTTLHFILADISGLDVSLLCAYFSQ